MVTVFLSYTHDTPANRERVGKLAARLSADLSPLRITVITDHGCPPGGPDDGWDVWSEKQAERSNILLPVFNATYRKCWDGEQPPGVRAGATAEARIIRRRIYDAGGPVSFARVVIFEAADRDFIHDRIKGLHSFLCERDYADLLAWIKHATAAMAATPATTTAGPLTVSWPAPLAGYEKPIADRDPAWDAFTALLNGASKERALVIKAETNLGKTALVNACNEYARTLLGGHSVARVDFKDSGTTAELCGKLRLDLASLLPRFSASSSDNAFALRHELRTLTQPVVIILDTYEQATDDARKFVESHLLGELATSPALRLVIAGQPKGFPDFSKTSYAGVVREVPLLPLTKDDVQPFVLKRHAHIGADAIETLVLATNGVPGAFFTLVATLAAQTPPAKL